MSNRQTELLNNCFGYLSELISDEKELKRVLTKTIGMTKQELADYGFCFEPVSFNLMCLDCARLEKDCEGSTNPVWTGCVHKEKIKVDYASKFKQLLELSDNLKTGYFNELETDFDETGFSLFSQVASLKVTFNPRTTEWRIRIYCAELSTETIYSGTGWDNLIQYLCVSSEITWFINMSAQQIHECKL